MKRLLFFLVLLFFVARAFAGNSGALSPGIGISGTTFSLNGTVVTGSSGLLDLSGTNPGIGVNGTPIYTGTGGLAVPAQSGTVNMVTQPYPPVALVSDTSIANCLFYLDPALVTGSLPGVSGSTYTVWNDASGAGNNATTISGQTGVTYVRNGINGHPALQFSGSNGLNVPVTTGSSYTFFSVHLDAGALGASTAAGPVLTIGTGASNTYLWGNASNYNCTYVSLPNGYNYIPYANGSVSIDTVVVSPSYYATYELGVQTRNSNANGGIAVNPSLSATCVQIGIWDANQYYYGLLGPQIMVSGTMSPQSIAAVSAALMDQYRPTAQTAPIAVVDGDSIAAGEYGNGIPQALMQYLGYPTLDLRMVCWGGKTELNSAAASTPALIASADLRRPDNIFLDWVSSNDIASGTSGATVYAETVAKCQQMRAAGWRVLVIPMIARGSSLEAQRQILNKDIYAGYQGFADDCLNLTTEAPLLDSTSYNASTTGTAALSYDGTHPTTWGYGGGTGFLAAVAQHMGQLLRTRPSGNLTYSGTGQTTITGNVTATGNGVVNGSLSVGGSGTVNGALNVLGVISTIQGNLTSQILSTSGTLANIATSNMAANYAAYLGYQGTYSNTFGIDFIDNNYSLTTPILYGGELAQVSGTVPSGAGGSVSSGTQGAYFSGTNSGFGYVPTFSTSINTPFTMRVIVTATSAPSYSSADQIFGEYGGPGSVGGALITFLNSSNPQTAEAYCKNVSNQVTTLTVTGTVPLGDAASYILSYDGTNMRLDVNDLQGTLSTFTTATSVGSLNISSNTFGIHYRYDVHGATNPFYVADCELLVGSTYSAASNALYNNWWRNRLVYKGY